MIQKLWWNQRLDFFLKKKALQWIRHAAFLFDKNYTKNNIYVSLMRLKYWKRTFLITKEKETYYYMMNKKKKESFIQKLLPRTGYFIYIYTFCYAFLPIFLFCHKAKENCFLIEKMRYKKNCISLCLGFYWKFLCIGEWIFYDKEWRDFFPFLYVIYKLLGLYILYFVKKKHFSFQKD